MLNALNLLIGQHVKLYIGNDGILEPHTDGTLYKHHKYYRVNNTIFTFDQISGVNVENTFVFISMAVNY